MTDVAHLQEAEKVSAQLSQAWDFLGGVARHFDFLVEPLPALAYAEYSFVLPMSVYAEQRTGGVGVLIAREDALQVASHMFGMDAAQVQDADLQDACAEVCNVFSDCIALHVSGNEDVSIGLPSRISGSDFEHISQHSVVAAVYQSHFDAATLWVVVYDVFCQPT
jgi:hypothetical protein